MLPCRLKCLDVSVCPFSPETLVMAIFSPLHKNFWPILNNHFSQVLKSDVKKEQEIHIIHRGE